MVVLQLLDSSAGPSPLQITADPSDSITHIRARISSLHPSAPAVGDIRLVRAGRLLRDGETVLDVLGSEAVRAEDEGPHLIHLVLRPGHQQPHQPQPAAATTTTQATGTQPASTSVPPAMVGLDGRPIHLPTPAASAAPPHASGVQPTPAAPVTAAPTLPYHHALSDALSLYTFLANDALCEMLALARPSWDGQQPPPLIGLAYAQALVQQTMETVGIESALGDAMAGRRRLDEWVPAEGQQLEVNVDGVPYALAIPPLYTLSADEQYAIQRYLMFTTRLSLLDALLRSDPPVAAAGTALPAPTPTARGANGNQVAVVMTLMGMNLIKYVVVWYLFTQEDEWFESFLWAAGLAAVWLWEAWKSYRRLQPRPPVPATLPPHAAAGADAASTDGDRPLPPLPTYRLPSAATPFHALLAAGLSTENDRLLLSPATTRPGDRPAGRPSVLKRLLLPPFLLVCSVAPPLEAYRRHLIRQRETAMRELSAALTARAAREPDSVRSLALPADRRLVPDGLPSPAERAYWARVVDRDERVDWAEEEEAQRRLGGEQDDREREEAEGGLLALLF